MPRDEPTEMEIDSDEDDGGAAERPAAATAAASPIAFRTRDSRLREAALAAPDVYEAERIVNARTVGKV